MATAKTAREFQAAVEGELAVALGMPRVSVRIFARRRARQRAQVKELETPRSPSPTDGLDARKRVDEAPAPEAPPVTLETGTADTRLTLASFIVGPGNEIAHRFATAIAGDPGNSYWNPLVLHGGTGTGKTHLLHALANDYQRRNPARRVVVASSERFATQFSLSVRGGQAARFRELYREADLLVVDDIQSLSGKAETEKELLHTIDELVNRRRQVVLGSAFGPKRLPKIDAGLEGRLLQGLVVELKPADEPTRERLVRARAAVAKLQLDEPIVPAHRPPLRAHRSGPRGAHAARRARAALRSPAHLERGRAHARRSPQRERRRPDPGRPRHVRRRTRSTSTPRFSRARVASPPSCRRGSSPWRSRDGSPRSRCVRWGLTSVGVRAHACTSLIARSRCSRSEIPASRRPTRKRCAASRRPALASASPRKFRYRRRRSTRRRRGPQRID